MNTLTLQRNVQFLYEGQMARIELQALGCAAPGRDEDDERIFKANLNGELPAIRDRSAYIGTIDGEETVYSQLITPAYQGGRYNRTRSVNQYLTHWIYPYRGKFHPQMVRGLLNILKIRPGQWIIDPFSGSGTTALEASLLGINAVGVDRSDVCEYVGRVKTHAWTALDLIRERVRELDALAIIRPADVNPAKEADDRVREFIQVAKLITCSSVARRGKEEEPTFRRTLKQMLESVEAHAQALRQFHITPGEVRIVKGDARDLRTADLADASMDGCVSSPPYSIALDYVKNDEHALTELGVSMDALRAQMVGVRGKGVGEKLEAYNQDMKRAFAELARVLKSGAGAAIVIGDATVGGEEVTTTGEMVGWAENVGLRHQRTISKIVFGLYNVMNDEKILIFKKE